MPPVNGQIIKGGFRSMPISKHRRKSKKRNEHTQPPKAEDGFMAYIQLFGINVPDDLIADFHNDGIALYNRGREDKLRGAPPVTYREFAARSELPAMYISIVQAQHAQYMDGYNGDAYRDRVIFTKDFLL